MTSFDPQLAQSYYQQVFGDRAPVKLSEFIPGLEKRTYNLMTKTDRIKELRERFKITDEFAGGVYTFWWLGSADELNKIDSFHKIKGKKESESENLRNAEEQGYITKDGHIIHEGEYHY